jgi:transcriptional regulator with XRE-family HTH domain
MVRMGNSGITYSALLAAGKNGTPPANKNQLSALRTFISHLGLTLDSPVGPEYLLPHNETIEAYVHTKAHSSRTAFRANLQYWRAHVAALHASDTLPSDLRTAVGETIQRLLDQRRERNQSTTLSDLASEMEVSYSTLVQYLNLSTKIPRSITVLSALEVAAGLPTGRLTSQIPNPRASNNFVPASLRKELLGSKTQNAITGIKKLLPDNFPLLSHSEQRSRLEKAIADVETPRKKLLSSFHKSVYALSIKAPKSTDEDPAWTFDERISDQLKEEIMQLVNFKCNSQDSSLRWNTERTVQHSLHHLGSFFGWYLLPVSDVSHAESGFGGSPEDLTLALFTVPSLVTRWLNWLTYVRGRGPTKASLPRLSFVASLNHPENGFLANNVMILSRIPKRFDARNEFDRYLLEAVAKELRPTDFLLQRLAS